MNTVQLERECRTYTRYLVRQDPTPYVIEKYLDFHRKSGLPAGGGCTRFDRFLSGLSARGPFWVRLADSYASQFCKRAAVRRKLVLTLALLECAPPTFEILDAVDGGSWLATFARMGARALRYATALAASTLIFTPIRLAMALAPARRSGVAER